MSVSLEGHNPMDPKRALAANRRIAESYRGPQLLTIATVPVVIAIVAAILGWPWWVYVVCGFLFLIFLRIYSDEQNAHHRALERIEFLEGRLEGEEEGDATGS